jgi:AhpD family alkylhydroperoxidase
MEPRITFQQAPKGMYEVMTNVETYLKKCGIDHSLIELIKIRASQINGCGYCLDMHHKDALKDGESIQRLYLLPAWKESPVYSEEEKVVLNLTEVLTTISESDPEVIAEAYDRVATHYSKEQIANLVLAICQINSWNRIAITFGSVPGTYKVNGVAAPAKANA